MTGTNLDFVLLRGVYLIISCLVAQQMFNISIFLSTDFLLVHELYIFSNLTHNLSPGAPKGFTNMKGMC